MSYSKNDCVELTIEDIGVSGEGIGKVDGYTLFVKDTVIGDVVRVKIMKAKKNYGYARLMDIIKPSKDRVEPACPIARQCGGCQIQAMNYNAQLKYKQKLVKDNLLRISGLTEGADYEMCEILGMDTPFRYRNKAQYPVGEDKDGNIVMGFYAGHTHSIIACPDDDCMLGHSDNAFILNAVKEWMKEYRVRAYNENIHKGTVRHVLVRTGYHTDEVMVCLVTKKILDNTNTQLTMQYSAEYRYDTTDTALNELIASVSGRSINSLEGCFDTTPQRNAAKRDLTLYLLMAMTILWFLDIWNRRMPDLLPTALRRLGNLRSKAVDTILSAVDTPQEESAVKTKQKKITRPKKQKKPKQQKQQASQAMLDISSLKKGLQDMYDDTQK